MEEGVLFSDPFVSCISTKLSLWLKPLKLMFPGQFYCLILWIGQHHQRKERKKGLIVPY